MGNDPLLAILAHAQNLATGTQASVCGIVKRIAFEGAGRDKLERARLEILFQDSTIANAKLYLGFKRLHTGESTAKLTKLLADRWDIERKMSQTLILPIDVRDIAGPSSGASLGRAAQILRDGGTVAFPTETVYGLGANALDAAAVEKIFLAKQRPSWDPLIVHIGPAEMLLTVATNVSTVEHSLMKTFWPGPLTLLLPRSERVPTLVSAGRQKIGVRRPLHPVAQALIAHAGFPIAAPSANSFGRTSPTTAQHVLEDLNGRIDAILDGGPTTLGLESTVIDASAVPPTLYRHGMVSIEQLQLLVPGLVSFTETPAMEGAPPASLPSPGVGMKHYAPRARLVLIEGGDIERALRDAVLAAKGKRVGVLLPEDFVSFAETGIAVWHWGRWTHPDEMALKLFAGLRALDGQGVEIILCPLPPGAGIGAALRDRLTKAAKSAG